MASQKKNSVSSIDPYVDIAILKSTKTQFRNVRDPLPYSKAYTLHLLCNSPTVILIVCFLGSQRNSNNTLIRRFGKGSVAGQC
jgi:hypothetical protein